jgi:hypothetical protein
MGTTFVDQYEETVQVPLRGGFHATLRKYLSAHDIFVADTEEHPGSAILVTSIVEWDVTGKDGNVLKIDIPTVESLPSPVFNLLNKRVSDLLKESSTAETDGTFQSESDRSDTEPEVQ